MNATCPCADPSCARCGRPVIVWSDEAPDPTRRPPRTDPPRHAEKAALALYERVASRPPRLRRRIHTRGIARGGLLMITAAIVYYFEWDIALLRLGSLALAGFGLVALLKGLMGYSER